MSTELLRDFWLKINLLFLDAYGGWFAPRAHHSVRMTYRPSAALRLVGSLRISHNKFLWANKWILILNPYPYLYYCEHQFDVNKDIQMTKVIKSLGSGNWVPSVPPTANSYNNWLDLLVLGFNISTYMFSCKATFTHWFVHSYISLTYLSKYT